MNRIGRLGYGACGPCANAGTAIGTNSAASASELAYLPITHHPSRRCLLLRYPRLPDDLRVALRLRRDELAEFLRRAAHRIERRRVEELPDLGRLQRLAHRRMQPVQDGGRC